MRRMVGLAAALALSLGAGSAAAEGVKIGFMATLSGPPAALGTHMRDGFMLAVKEGGGKLGGVPVEVVVVDDELKPDVALTKVQGLIERDQIDLMAGVVFSNVMMAVYKPVVEAEVFFVGTNAGPSPIAGAQCSPFFFSTSWSNDNNDEAMGAYANAAGFQRVFIMAPNYQAGKDALAGFKRMFKGEIVDEVYTQLGQLDFSAELARIAAANPDALYTFMPGGMGVNLVKQYTQAGLNGRIPFLSKSTVDETTLPAMQDAAVGMFAGAQWAPDLDVAANKAFVAAFEAEYGYVPSMYAAQGYDGARLIASVLSSTGDDLADIEKVRAAFKAADFDSVRGDFAFNTNGFPIQDFYTVKAVKRDDGKYATSVVERVLDDHKDAYFGECPLN